MHAAPCGMFHVNLQEDDVYIRCSNFSQETATFTKPVGFSFPFGCAKSQNLAVLREIAKYNTRKIVRIPKSQNFVLANNSNIKVQLGDPSVSASVTPPLPLIGPQKLSGSEIDVVSQGVLCTQHNTPLSPLCCLQTAVLFCKVLSTLLVPQ